MLLTQYLIKEIMARFWYEQSTHVLQQVFRDDALQMDWGTQCTYICKMNLTMHSSLDIVRDYDEDVEL